MAQGEAVGLLGSPTPRVGFRWHREAVPGAPDVRRDTGQRYRTDSTGGVGEASRRGGGVYLRIVVRGEAVGGGGWPTPTAGLARHNGAVCEAR